MPHQHNPLLKELIKHSIWGMIIQCFLVAPTFGSEVNKKIVAHEFLPIADINPQEITITGTVTSADDGSGLPGVSVVIKGSSRGTTTDADGRYTLPLPQPDAVLVFSFIGYTSQEVQVNARSVIDIAMTADIQQLGEVVVVAYGTQARENVTGAVTQVQSKEIVTTKNENVQNMLTGKVAGLRVRQNNAEPGQFNSSIDIRGFGNPLVVIDGIPRDNMQRLDPEDIESISVVKDATAATFGARAANGVILITTKKGTRTGEPSITYSGNMGWQRPSNYPNLVDAAQWMTLYNERDRHNVDNSNPLLKYTPEQIEEYRNGTKVSTDWRDAVLRASAPQTQHNLSATGGNDKITYYTSVGYQYQGSFLQTDAINYKKYNFRSNISAKVRKDLTFDLNLAGLSDERQQAPYGSNDIVRAMWLHRPIDQIYYNESESKYGMMDWNVILNPVAMMDKHLVGENKYQSRWLQSNISLKYDAPFLNGLSLSGLFSYDYTMNDNKEYTKAFTLYKPNGDLQMANTQAAGNSRISRFFYSKNSSLWRLQIAFERQFGDHYINVMNLLENAHYQGDNFYGRRFAVLPLPQIFAGITDRQEMLQSTDRGALYDYANRASVGRAMYNFKGKYLAEFSYRYEGNSRYPEANRWGFFPAVSTGWRISEENFWTNSSLSFINNMKLRASYGITGDDSGLTYQFATGFQYPAPGGSRTGLPAGYIFGSSFVPSSSSTGLPNTAITWLESKTTNIGIDADAWNGLLGISFEYFNRDREGLYATRAESLPGIVGAVLPQENLESDQNRGFEIELRHENRVGEITYQVRGNISYTRVKTIYAEMARPGNSYQNWRNGRNQRFNNIWWGYAGNGRITSWDEIYYNPIYIARNSILGDYEYQDWNGDGYISDLDVHPLATNGHLPLINYGVTLSAQWKGIDLNMLWQGAGKRYMIAREFLYQPLWSNSNALADFYNRWHPTDVNADPYDPATQWTSGAYAFTGTSPDQTSDFNIQNAAYLRLKSIEIGYTLPNKILSSIGLQNVRIYGNSYNLLTFTKLRYLDPEFYTNNDTSKSGLTDLGYNYPLNKSYSIGINAKF
ncbi:SusC/RagA family TonB-linked outer membrane protein [Chryseosolibacter indicus]|uniref:TonB-dependent receptor n=1 Tax=Chryseosolibacter indicus TaxID=2782351 RepID=A0ABS5VW09_9BACT|nr:TonB-dependent receptor [Chryseosolibacter indicus]MBT1705627.1 TonB-dependent receptor [Chryseosolibacter indicus]